MRQALNLASKIKLLGVVVGDRDGISAIIEELGSKRQLFLRLHDEIPDIGELSEIRRNGIVVRQGNQQEFLELSTGQEKPPMPQPVSTGPAASGGRRPDQEGPGSTRSRTGLERSAQAVVSSPGRSSARPMGR